MRKFLFLPHCLRHATDCIATFDENGYICQLCDKCKVSSICQKADEYGFKVLIVPGGSLVKKLFKTLKIKNDDIVIGVACDAELKDFKKNFLSFLGAKPDGGKSAVKLTVDGCINTDLNLDELFSQMKKNK